MYELTRYQLDFIVGFSIAQHCVKHGYSLNPKNSNFVSDVESSINDALSWLDSDDSFESEATREINEMLGES